MLINISNQKLNDLSIVSNGTHITRAIEAKILGVIFDERLSFKSHINYISKRISDRINFISRLRHRFPLNALNIIFKSIVMPIIDYGIIF